MREELAAIAAVPCSERLPGQLPTHPLRDRAVRNARATGGACSPTSPPRLRVIREDIGDCTRCKLSRERTNIVFGVGDPHARIMFVGEGPGADEDAQGEPFVGRAGQLLNNMINAMGIRREDVYIANVVKCRPPQNRAPERDECDTCGPFLMRQISVVRPEIIVALGATAAKYLLGVADSMANLRGHIYDFHPITPHRPHRSAILDFTTKLVVTYHPAYLLRDPRQKKETWLDLQMVMKYLGMTLPKREAAPQSRGLMRRRIRQPHASHLLLPVPQALYCDVALPVPLDLIFTYEAGELEPIVGGRVVVPFGRGAEKKLSGIVTRVHREPPRDRKLKRVLQVLDTIPVLDEDLLALGRWIASYYLAPIGEVYRTMLPLQAEFRQAFGYRITELGAEALYDSARRGLLHARRRRIPRSQLSRIRRARRSGRRRPGARGASAHRHRSHARSVAHPAAKEVDHPRGSLRLT